MHLKVFRTQSIEFSLHSIYTLKYNKEIRSSLEYRNIKFKIGMYEIRCGHILPLVPG